MDSCLVFAPGNGEGFAYAAPDIAATLERHYAGAALGLLPCEPNWIYPLGDANTVLNTVIERVRDRLTRDHSRRSVTPRMSRRARCCSSLWSRPPSASARSRFIHTQGC